jgi:hypothetical protein
MPGPRVYVETTIPSFYHEVRSAPDVVARREWTRQWWATAYERYELVTSPAVLDELSGGDPSRVAERLALVGHLPLLAIDPSIVEIVETYIRHKVMPADPGGDALHLALASPQVRLPGDLELPASGQREQVRPHPPRQRHARAVCARAGHPA